MNKRNTVEKWQFGELAINDELCSDILDGRLDFCQAMALVEETVFICDKAILRASNNG